MKIETGDDGRRKFVLGPVELVIAGLLPTALIGMLVANWNQQQAVSERLVAANFQQATQMVSVQEQLKSLSGAVLGLPDRMTRVESKTEENTRDIEEFRKVRSLR